MNELPAKWKLFRVACIIQMVLVACQLMLSVTGLFWRKQLVYPITEIIAYSIIFFFVYMGLSLLNDNYPDTPLTPKQKRNFNYLFIVNFLLIAYLFAQVIAEWRRVVPYLFEMELTIRSYIILSAMLAMNLVIFALHLVFLVGMFNLRRAIYRNTMHTWYNQFDEEKK